MEKWHPKQFDPASLKLMIRAGDVLRAYELAEALFHQIQSERDELDARFQSMLNRWARRIATTRLSDQDYAVMESELLFVSELLQMSLAPWQQAHFTLLAAFEDVQAVLREAGFKPRLSS